MGDVDLRMLIFVVAIERLVLGSQSFIRILLQEAKLQVKHKHLLCGACIGGVLVDMRLPRGSNRFACVWFFAVDIVVVLWRYYGCLVVRNMFSIC